MGYYQCMGETSFIGAILHSLPVSRPHHSIVKERNTEKQIARLINNGEEEVISA
jgi:hypothetical protein